MARPPKPANPFSALALGYRRLAGTAERYQPIGGGPSISKRSFYGVRRQATIKTGTPLAAKASSEDKYYRVVGRVAGGEKLTAAARAEHINPETVKRLNRERGLLQQYKPGLPYTRAQAHGSTPILHPDGTYLASPQVDARYASILGSYWNIIDEVLKGSPGAARALAAYANVTVKTTDGQAHKLMYDANAVFAFFGSMTPAEEADFWREFYPGKGVAYAAA